VKALVLYDSKFGNTERIAEAVALALQESVPTRLASIADVGDCAEALAGVDLLLVGGPTHRHGISVPLRETLERLEGPAFGGMRVAVFDTRPHGTRLLTGSAAVRLARLLRRRGAWLVVPPASFVVESAEGPLERGELEHARDWALEVLQAVGVYPRAVRARLHPVA
jgi:flavodoxin